MGGRAVDLGVVKINVGFNDVVAVVVKLVVAFRFVETVIFLGVVDGKLVRYIVEVLVVLISD
jgi:hypothetical protein